MDLKTITSPQNPLVKELLRVGKKPAGSGFLIEGPHPVEMAVSGGVEISLVLLTADFLSKSRWGPLVGHLAGTGAEIREVTGPVMKKVSGTEAPQGILALARMRPVSLSTLKIRKPALIAVSGGIKEPGNLGALIRAADAACASCCVLLPGSCNPFSSKALRAGAGSFFNLPVVEAGLEELSGWLARHGIPLAAADAQAETSLFDYNLRGPVAIAFGEEAHGLGADIRQRAGVLLKIPICGRAESLNVAASAAVFLFEAMRQRQGGKK